MTFKDHFSTKSNDYATYRPSYPKALAEALANLCDDRSLVLDCACGTGQLSVVLSDYFKQVIATDASSAQIANAQPYAGVSYRVASAENSQLADHSVDLISVAQAAHWLDLESFYAEVKRIVKPNGVLALITYGILSVDDLACDRVAHDFYHNTLDDYWPPERRHVESGYQTLPFPFEEVVFPSLQMCEQWNFHQLFGYFSTWSAFKALEQANGQEAVEAFRHALSTAWGDLNCPKQITWPLSVRVGVDRRYR